MKFKPPTTCEECPWCAMTPARGYKTGWTCTGYRNSHTWPHAPPCAIGIAHAEALHRIAELEADIEADAERRTYAQYQRTGKNWGTG